MPGACAYVRVLTCGRVKDDEDTRRPLAEVEHRPLQQLSTEVNFDSWAPVFGLFVDHFALLGRERSPDIEWFDPVVLEIARKRVCRAEAWIRTGPLLPKAVAGDPILRLLVWEVAELCVEPTRPQNTENSCRAGRGASFSTSATNGCTASREAHPALASGASARSRSSAVSNDSPRVQSSCGPKPPLAARRAR